MFASSDLLWVNLIICKEVVHTYGATSELSGQFEENSVSNGKGEWVVKFYWYIKSSFCLVKAILSLQYTSKRESKCPIEVFYLVKAIWHLI